MSPISIPRPRAVLLIAAAGAALTAAGPAAASVPHTVMPGESLASIATADGLSPAAVAAASGLSPTAELLAGSTVQIPAFGAPAAPATTATAASAPAPLGGYTVRPGDTLSGLAATAGVPVSAIASMNGLDPAGLLLAGTVVKLPTGSPAPARSAEPAPAAVVPAASPVASSGHVTSGEIATVATRNGVPASLASAIGWQESGFNNAMVSSANARGVMQVMPGTWQWVQANLAKRTLNPSNPIDNVGAGVLYLGHLLKETNGDPAMTAAAYYQGLSSVRAIGMLPETRQYVDNVMALRSRFGG